MRYQPGAQRCLQLIETWKFNVNTEIRMWGEGYSNDTREFLFCAVHMCMSVCICVCAHASVCDSKERG